MSDVAWLFVAFAAVWIAIGGYLLSLGARQKRLEGRLQNTDGADDATRSALDQIHKP